ncbi:GAF domain-containing sensor histidine kinase [Iodobacter sp. CM08]|uniref:GAF domain-containing sensor histidine kinase n=1 Tax=Iodobacter sp. CM08 TaxID=3085902 RepID=UPI0029815CA2|nr:GAF domain-containing sensor histidine kinase [Iodobacter sp. CM08]MDW5416179.1 GAF domain-containing sensor histidine kinase [Iodobacter sp. CM08]
MELFISNQELAALEPQLSGLLGKARLAMLVRMAWHQRQRNCALALALADEAELLLGLAEEREAQQWFARLLLLRAEVKMLFSDFDGALPLIAAAQAIFENTQDTLGRGDAAWLEAYVFNDRGQSQATEGCLLVASDAYRLLDDALRLQMVEARRLLYGVFRDPSTAGAALQRAFPEPQSYASPLFSFIAAAKGLVAILTNSPSAAIKYFLQAYEAALDSGQLRSALVSANNIADSFDQLGDQETALEWVERAMCLARSTGWPVSMGACKLVAAGIMRKLEKYDEARACLQGGLLQMEHLANTRNYSLALDGLGLLELDVGNIEAGLSWFEKLEAHEQSRISPDILGLAWRGQASALFKLGRLDEARSKAEATLQLAIERGNADVQIKALWVLAQIYTQADLPAPIGMTKPSASLHYLHQALDVATRIESYAISPELFTQIAAAYAVCGDYPAAYDYSLTAAAIYKKTHSIEVEKRALAMQIRHEVERAHAETAHHRQIAAALQETSATLEVLGQIGREITANLNAHAVFTALHRHVSQLLDVSSFVVFLLDDHEPVLHFVFGMESEQLIYGEKTPLAHPSSKAARCAREKQVQLVHLEPDHQDATLIPGTVATMSLLFAPLMVGERLLGVMSIQTPTLHAYGERELSIFLALCAYGAIALDNAAAYAAAEASQSLADRALSDLRQTQGELIQREKLASLGSLVAGVAHELNTPIGNSLLVASTISDDSERFLRQIKQGGVRRSDLERYCLSAEESSSLLIRCLQKAASLITSFKQLAVDQTSDQQRSFDLRTECEDVALMLGSRIRGAGHELKLDIADGLQMNSYPGAFGQVLSNLIINAIVHGLEGRKHGLMSIQANAINESHVKVIFKDNGRGISSDHIDRIFEPFFTTQLGQGGSGLGLHISYNIIYSVLGGSISVISPEGEGAIFEMILPFVAQASPS